MGVPTEPVTGSDAGDLVLRGVTVYGIRHGLDHYGTTIRLLAEGALEAKPLIHAVLPLERAAEAFHLLEHGRNGVPKIILSLREGA